MRYEKPEMDVIILSLDYIVTTSTGTGDEFGVTPPEVWD